MRYTDYLNFNFNQTQGLDYYAIKKIWEHVKNNTNRTYGQHLLKKQPEIENIIFQDCETEDDLKKIYKEWKDLPQKNNKSKPFKCITLQLNLDPTKDNEKIIKTIMAKVNDFFGEYYNPFMVIVHNNETKAGIHILCKNWYNGKIGNYNKRGELKKLNGYFAINLETGEKVDIQSRDLKQFKLEHPNWKVKDYGKELFKEIWTKGQELINAECEKFGLKFKQEPVTDKGLARKYNNIQNFREWKEWLKDSNSNEEKNVWKEKAEKLEKEVNDLSKTKKDLEIKNKNLTNENIRKEKQINNLIQKDEKINWLENQLEEKNNLINSYEKEDERYDTYKFGNNVKRLLNNQKIEGETPDKQLANLIIEKNKWREYAQQLKQELDQKNNNYENQNFRRNQNEK